MPVTPDNILYHELIGLNVRVADSPATSSIGLSGLVIDETMKTLVIQDKGDGRRKTILKDHATLAFTLPSGKEVLVEGSLVVGRPWDRLKNIGKRKFTSNQRTKKNKR